MRTILLSVLALSLTSLTGCETNPVNQSSSARTVDLGGAQARYSVELPEGGTPPAAEAPFALQGAPRNASTEAPGGGYQAR